MLDVNVETTNIKFTDCWAKRGLHLLSSAPQHTKYYLIEAVSPAIASMRMAKRSNTKNNIQNALHTFIGFVDIKYFVPALLRNDIE